MSFLHTFWNYLALSAPYLLTGFALSGLVHFALNKKFLQRKLSSQKITDVFWAALIGVPLPLCSCSVIPTAATLRKNGASTGATSSFLIATPESGIDSIAMSYSMMDLPMTIIRPIAAFISAITAGVGNFLFNNVKAKKQSSPEKKSCCHHSHTHKPSQFDFKKILFYGFTELLDDMIGWLCLGLILGSIISYVVPEGFFLTMNPHISKIVIIAIGVPLYICASASTPIAASLVLKGMLPGTVLIFLLVGPATNISNIAILQKYIGKKGVIINITSIILVAVLFSYIVDYLYQNFLPLQFHIGQLHQGHGQLNIFHHTCATIFALLILASLWRVYGRKKHGEHT